MPNQIIKAQIETKLFETKHFETKLLETKIPIHAGHTDQTEQHTFPMTGQYPHGTNTTQTNLTETSMNHNIGTESKQAKNRKLPIFLLSNIRSFGNSENTDKTIEIEAILNLNNIDIACLTETWLNETTRDSVSINNYENFHLVRKNTQRSSGGVSILVKDNIPANRVDIKVPDHIETLWVTIRPKWLPRSISNIVVAGVYYPGSTSDYAPNKEDIILHITESVHNLYKRYANPLFVIMGDFNDLKVNVICSACSLNQVVKVPTRKEAILDLILTNITNNFYKKPITLPSIGTSDHLSVLYEPVANPRTNLEKKKIIIRKYHKSAMIAFGSWLIKFDWSVLLSISDVNLKVAYFFEIMWIMIDKYFPPVKVVTTQNDNPWITSKIKSLIAKRQKAHKSKNFCTRNQLAKTIIEEVKNAKKKYKESMAKSLSKGSSTKEWFQHITKIINNGKRNNMVLSNVPELAQKPMEEIVNIVNNQFAAICQTYPPLNKDSQVNANHSEADLQPISEFDTYRLIKKFAKKSLVPSDFPRQILQEFAIYLALPFSDITNCALRSGIFPDAYKISEIVPIPKENPPRALKDLRPISKTPIGGKILEKCLISELEKDTKNTLNDPTQYGNTKGSNTTHYLIKLTHEAHKSTNVGNATTAITIDYSKAFDLVDHSTLKEKLIELGVRNRLLKLIISFLNNRKHYTNINGVRSKLTEVTCGVPQGTISGPRLFTILIKGVKCPMVLDVKFVDDKTLIHSYSGDPTPFLQNVLNIENSETIKDKMKINESKCNIINFNFSSKNSPPQNLELNNNKIISVDRVKLLGVIISNDLSWRENTAEIVKKVNKKFYKLCRLRKFGVKQDVLLTTWKIFMRPIAEYAAPLWHSSLLECDKCILENLQKKALALILGTIYIDYRRYYRVKGKPVSYEQALQACDLLPLNERREILTINFAHETYKNPKHKDLFEEISEPRPNTRYKPKVKEPSGSTSRFIKSAVPVMSKMINSTSSTKN